MTTEIRKWGHKMSENGDEVDIEDIIQQMREERMEKILPYNFEEDNALD